MERYDPDQEPDSTVWLELDESERIDLVMSYHRDVEAELPNEWVHATIHVVVENQLALVDETVCETFQRLMRGGLDRHEAIHAIGAVLAGHIFELNKAEEVGPDFHRRYYKRLEKLTAKRWRKGKW